MIKLLSSEKGQSLVKLSAVVFAFAAAIAGTGFINPQEVATLPW